MDEIKGEILKTVEKEETIRIVVDVPTDLLHSDDYIHSASDFIQPFYSHWRMNHKPRLLVVDVYPRHTFVVVDINNHHYDFDQAHQQYFAIPVYIHRFFGRKDSWKFFRYATQDRKLAADIAELHFRNDQNPIPFLTDHIEGPVYLSHRTT